MGTYQVGRWYIMKNKKLWIFIIMLIVLIIVVSYFVLKQTHVIDQKQHSSYQTYTVKKSNALKLKGKSSPQTIKTYQENREIGEYIRPQIQNNQTVRKGTPLVYYDTNRSIRPKLVEDVKKMQNYIERDYDLINKHPNNQTYQQRLSKDQDKLSQAQQNLTLHDNKSSKDIYATFDGKVNYINKDIDKNGNIFQLISNQPQIKTTISEYDIDKVKEGDKVDISVNKGDKKLQGKVIQIADLSTESQKSVDHASKDKSTPIQDASKPSKYAVTVGNLNTPIKDGFTVDMNIHVNTIQLPTTVLTKDNNVFVVDKHNRVHKRAIITGHTDDKVIVKQGLKVGEKLIKHPKSNLQEGQKIKPSE